LASFHGKCLLKLQEKSIDLLKSLAIILPQNAKEVSKINVLQINQQTLYSLFDISLILLLDIAGAIFAMLTIILAKIPKAERDLSEKMPHILTEAKEGFHALHRQKGMTALVVLNAVYAIIYFPIGSLYPLLCMSYFGGTFKESSIVEIVFSTGTLLGALILGKWGSKINQITVILISIVVMGAGLILTGSLRPDQLNVFIVLAGIMGITIPFYHGVLMSIFQIKIDESYLGRVLSLSASLGMVAMPIGLVLAGTFADVMGVEKWFFISGILTLFVAVAFYSMPTIRNCCKEIEMDTK
jgi:DHA3 family macrolide efflux protein-like MFS transporter